MAFTFNEKTGNIKITRGNTAEISFEILDDDDVAVTFETGDIAYFTVKRNINTKEILIQKIITEFNEDGILTFNLEQSDTKRLNYGEYVYDIQISDVSGNTFTMIFDDVNLDCPKFIVTGEVTFNK